MKKYIVSALIVFLGQDRHLSDVFEVGVPKGGDVRAEVKKIEQALEDAYSGQKTTIILACNPA